MCFPKILSLRSLYRCDNPFRDFKGPYSIPSGDRRRRTGCPAGEDQFMLRTKKAVPSRGNWFNIHIFPLVPALKTETADLPSHEVVAERASIAIDLKNTPLRKLDIVHVNLHQGSAVHFENHLKNIRLRLQFQITQPRTHRFNFSHIPKKPTDEIQLMGVIHNQAVGIYLPVRAFGV